MCRLLRKLSFPGWRKTNQAWLTISTKIWYGNYGRNLPTIRLTRYIWPYVVFFSFEDLVYKTKKYLFIIYFIYLFCTSRFPSDMDYIASVEGDFSMAFINPSGIAVSHYTRVVVCVLYNICIDLKYKSDTLYA